MDTFFNDMLNRSALWVQQAVRWSPSNVPPADAIIHLFSTLRPSLVVGMDAASTRSGRALARLTARLFARTFPGFVVNVMGDDTLQRELDALAEEVVPSRRIGSVAGTTVLVGNAVASVSGHVAIGTQGWESLMQHGGGFAPDYEFNPVAAMSAASFGLIEVTKDALRRFVPQFGGKWTEWDIEPTRHFRWSTFGPLDEGLVSPPFPDQLELGDFTLVSAGALNHALLAVLLEHGHCLGTGKVFDFDLLEPSNLNRYLLATYAAALLGLPKADFLSERVGQLIELDAVAAAFSAMDAVHGVAVVGADRVSARLDVQRCGPELIINGATELALVRVSVHGGTPGRACLGCINPVGDVADAPPAPTIAFIASLTGALMVGQLVRRTLGIAVPGTVLDLWPLQPGRVGNLTWGVVDAEPDCAICGRIQNRRAGHRA